MQLTQQELTADRQVHELALKANATLTASNYESERSLFFKGKENPEFIYSRIEHNTDDLKHEAAKIDIPDTVFGSLLRDKLNETISVSEFIAATTTEEATRASKSVFGEPSQSTLKRAKETIEGSKDDPAMVHSLKIPADQIVRALNDRLKQYGLGGWAAMQSRSPSQGITVSSTHKELRVQQGVTDTLESIEMIRHARG